MLSMNRGVVTRFSHFHAINRINDCFECNLVVEARAIHMTSNHVPVLFIKLMLKLIDSPLIIWLRHFNKVRFERICDSFS